MVERCMTDLISENTVHYDTCDSYASQVWQIQHARAPNSPLLNCLTGAKQNHCRERKMEPAGRCVEGRGRGEVGGSAVWEKCYNSELLSGVRSLNYSEMWTACQCWGLSQSCGQHHTHYTLLYVQYCWSNSPIYLSICWSVRLSVHHGHSWPSIHACTQLAPADVYWSRKLDGPFKFHTGHVLSLQTCL